MDTYKLHRWSQLKHAKLAEHRFLVMLSPFMEDCFNRFTAQIQQLENIHSKINKRTLTKMIRNDIKRLCTPLIVKTCVLNMHRAKAANALHGNTSEKRFASYIDLLTQQDYVDQFMLNYPALNKLLHKVFHNYQTYQLQFLHHLNADWHGLTKILIKQSKNLSVQDIQIRGDTHNNGQSVRLIVFNDQQKLVYKPRSFECETVFNDLLQWLNDKLPKNPLYKLKFISHPSYSWVEFIAHSPCPTSKLNSYYHRLGKLLAVSYLLNMKDLHYENIISYKNQPIVIDMECLLEPQYQIFSNTSSELPYYTVIDNYILPQKIYLNDFTDGFDMSVLGHKTKQKLFFKKTIWLDAGKDTMHAIRTDGRSRTRQNLPTSNNNKTSHTKSQIKALLDGFTSSFQLILTHKKFLLSKKSPLYKFRKTTTRILIRHTSMYAKLLTESYHPHLLQNIAERHAHFTWLKTSAPQHTNYKFVVNQEIIELMNNDIPYFHTATSRKIIFTSNHKKTRFPVKKTGWQILTNRLRHQLSKRDTKIQSKLIIYSMIANDLKNPINTQLVKLDKTKKFLSACVKKHTTFQAQAKAIIDTILNELCENYIVNNGNVSWPSIVMTPRLQSNANLCGNDLYDGICGIIIGYAYAYFLFKDRRYKRMLDICLNNLSNDLNSQANISYLAKYGAYTGIGSVLQTLFKLYQLFKDPIYLQLMRQFIKRSDSLQATHIINDVAFGKAGLLAVLTKLFNAGVHIIGLKSKMKKLAQEIHDSTPSIQAFINTQRDNQFTEPEIHGFAHGLFGMIWALHLYQASTKDTLFTDWISAAEQHLQQYRAKHPASKAGHWCSGHVGIGFATLELTGITASEFTHQQLAQAMTLNKRALRRFRPGSLCCGLLGDLDFYLETINKGMTQTSGNALSHLEAKLIQVIKHAGGYRFGEFYGCSMGIMQGRMGLCYILTRLLSKGRLPSILY